MPESEYITIGNRLLALQATRPDLSQREWAEKHGFNPTQWNNWVKGARRIPVDAAETLCEAYSLTLDFIYRGKLDGLSENSRKLF